VIERARAMLWPAISPLQNVLIELRYLADLSDSDYAVPCVVPPSPLWEESAAEPHIWEGCRACFGAGKVANAYVTHDDHTRLFSSATTVPDHLRSLSLLVDNAVVMVAATCIFSARVSLKRNTRKSEYIARLFFSSPFFPLHPMVGLCSHPEQWGISLLYDLTPCTCQALSHVFPSAIALIWGTREVVQFANKPNNAHIVRRQWDYWLKQSASVALILSLLYDASRHRAHPTDIFFWSPLVLVAATVEIIYLQHVEAAKSRIASSAVLWFWFTLAIGGLLETIGDAVRALNVSNTTFDSVIQPKNTHKRPRFILT
jgi:hypothetical protein